MSHQVAKDNSEGDKCPVMTMQIYGWTLVYFGGLTHFSTGLVHLNRGGGMTITLLAEKNLEKGFHIVTRVFFVEEVGCQACEHSL